MTLLSVPQNIDLVTKFLAYGKHDSSLHCSQKLAVEPHPNQLNTTSPSLLEVKDQVSHPHRAEKITFLYTGLFISL